MKRKDTKGSDLDPWVMKEPRKKPAGASKDTDKKARETTRKSYRGPVSRSDATEVQIGKKRYRLVDIGSKGIGIALPKPDSLSVGETYTIKLLLQKQSLELKGRVKHLSPSASEHYLCGVELLNLDKDTERKLQSFLQQKREQLFDFKNK